LQLVEFGAVHDQRRVAIRILDLADAGFDNRTTVRLIALQRAPKGERHSRE
jgi:hypothetical protein